MNIGRRYFHIREDIPDLFALTQLADAYMLANPGKQLYYPGDQILLGDDSLIVVDGTNTFYMLNMLGV